MRIGRLLMAWALGLGMLPAGAETVSQPRGGLTLEAELVTTGTDWHAGPVVLLTHGTLAHRQMEIIVALQEALAARGISSLAPTLSLGQSARRGMYDCAQPHRHRHADALDEIGSWLDWLQARGAQRLYLFGHSRGGNQAAWFAAERDRPALRGSILLAPSTWDAEAEAAAYRKRYGRELAPLLAQASARVAAGAPGELLEEIDFLYCAQTRASAAAFVGYYADEPRRDTPGLLPRLPKPTLVIAGSADTVVPGLAQRVGPLADGTRVQFELVDGADHFFRDLYADDVADHAAGFIQAH